jgi:hypothetical protein
MGLCIDPIVDNIKIYQGATFYFERRILQGETDATATPVNFTGCTGRAQARTDFAASSTLFEVRTDDATLTLGADGSVAFKLADEITAALPSLSKPGRWDLEIYWPDGETTRLFAGTVMLDLEVTRV